MPSSKQQRDPISNTMDSNKQHINLSSYCHICSMACVHLRSYVYTKRLREPTIQVNEILMDFYNEKICLLSLSRKVLILPFSGLLIYVLHDLWWYFKSSAPDLFSTVANKGKYRGSTPHSPHSLQDLRILTPTEKRDNQNALRCLGFNRHST